MSKKFMENAFRILKSVYYMEEPEKITKEIKKRMSSQEFAEVIIFLKKKELINIKDDKIPLEINLTDKGVEFVVNELDRKNQNEFNRIVAFTGAILALIAIYDFLFKLNLIKDFNWITAIFVVILIGALAPIISFIINSFFNRY